MSIRPSIGRFLSADSMIPNPYSTQDFNRYSYVLNNPLKYTDPSGHISQSSVKDDWIVTYFSEYISFNPNAVNYDYEGNAYWNTYIETTTRYDKPVVIKNLNTEEKSIVYRNGGRVVIRGAYVGRLYKGTSRHNQDIVNSLSKTWNNNKTDNWNQNRSTFNDIPRAMGGRGGITDAQARRNDAYLGSVASMAGGIGFSRAGLNGLNSGLNTLRNNPKWVGNGLDFIESGLPYGTPTPSNAGATGFGLVQIFDYFK